MRINKLFIIDDDQFYTHILEAKILKIGDYSIEKFHSGIECIDNAYKQPDIIFLDYNLEDTTGFEVLREIKATYPNIHIVMLSGQKEMKVAINALRFGATDYLLKDIDDNETRLSKIIHDCEQISKIRSEVQKKKRSKLLNIFFNL